MPYEELIPRGVEEMNADIDNAFDAYLAAGLAPWIVERIGPSVATTEPGHARRPEGSLDIPDLYGTLMRDVLGVSNSIKEWYRPDFVLPAADPVFSFAVVQTGEVDADGNPFNRARLTMTINPILPAHLANYFDKPPDSGPGHEVPDLDPKLVLLLPITDENGVPHDLTADGTISRVDAQTMIATFDILGDRVEAAYVHLAAQGGASILVRSRYSAYQIARVWSPDFGFPVHGPVFGDYQFELYGDGDTGAWMPVGVLGVYKFFPVTAAPYERTIKVGQTFMTDAYRSRFTITRGGLTRPIIDAGDLSDFAGPRSEYRELTSLGVVQERYPSLRRLYFGQVSGTVVAVPAGYGIVRGAGGLAASLDSIVDDSPDSVTGCRFHFTFTVAPLADPVELAQLSADLTTIPEAAGRTLRLTLPVALDARNPATLDGFPAATAVFADGVVKHTVQVGVDLTDDHGTPATTNVNLFLQQLATNGPAPLFANLAIRLDDPFPHPVRTQIALNLYQTAGSDELEVLLGADEIPTMQLVNRGPHDLVLRKLAVLRGGQPTIVGLANQALLAGRTADLPGYLGAFGAAVSRSMPLPVPLPKAALMRYLTFRTVTVQQVQHPLTVNAAGVNFTGLGITAIRVQITLTELPGIAVPALTLTAAHAIDFVHALIPVDAAVTGMNCTVALTLSTAAGERTVTRTHDFVDQPIFVITAPTIA
ncbi:hypothetical protein [Nocardia sp. NPDC049149]|uniref:hypothetical protein n=1 Tax=Nocardia sp. NPDC049149 TaxID=3364315 RepID=UPI0037148434